MRGGTEGDPISGLEARLREQNAGEPRRNLDYITDPKFWARFEARSGEVVGVGEDEAREPAKVLVKTEPVKSSLDPDDVLLTLEQAAERLNSTADQVRSLINDGSLRWVNVGRGEKRPRYRIKLPDLLDLIAARTTQEAVLCPSTRRKNTKASTSSTSGTNVIGLLDRRAALLAAKQKSTKL